MPNFPRDCYCGFAQGMGTTCVCGTDEFERRRDNLTFAIGMKLTTSAIVAEFVAGKSISNLCDDWRLSGKSVESVIRDEIKFLLRQV